MGVASKLVHRAQVWRPVHVGDDDYGQPIYDDKIVGLAVPCYVWYSSGERRDEETTTIRQYELKAAFLPNADVHVGDKIKRVEDRQGNLLYTGLRIEAIMRRRIYLDCVIGEYK